MHYVSGEEILAIHAAIIDETGGSHGVREIELFRSIIEKWKMSFGGKELYEGVFVKAATYCESLTQYHVFIDGNKRTALATSARFLFINGYTLTATNKELERFILTVVTKKIPIKKIAGWFKKYSKKYSSAYSVSTHRNAHLHRHIK